MKLCIYLWKASCKEVVGNSTPKSCVWLTLGNKRQNKTLTHRGQWLGAYRSVAPLISQGPATSVKDKIFRWFNNKSTDFRIYFSCNHQPPCQC